MSKRALRYQSADEMPAGMRSLLDAQLAPKPARAAPVSSGAPAIDSNVPGWLPQTGKTAARARPRHVADEMNKTEAAYCAHLERRKAQGEILWFVFEHVKLRLAKATFITVDFFVQLANGELEAHEVKGHWEEDARVKIKVAAALYPWRFLAVQKAKGAEWKVEEFG